MIETGEDLASQVGRKEVDWSLRSLVRKITADASKNTAIPLEVRTKVSRAYDEEEIKRKSDMTKESPIEVEEDTNRGATSVLDGGAFYTVTWHLPDCNIKYRVKKSRSRAKFERGRRVQEFLALAMGRGILNGGARINPILYRDDRHMETWELHIDHDRLTDKLRKAKTDEDKASILEKTLYDSRHISEVLTAYREMRDDEGDPLLKNTSGWLNYLRNFFPGNLGRSG